eukprot:7497619-Ditylum_brightwellii.AAC.1
MPAAKYTARNGGIVYTATPNHPGTYDGTIADNAGCVQQSRCEAEHKQHVDGHMIEQAVQNIIKTMLTEALPCWLLAELEDREKGLNAISILDILTMCLIDMVNFKTTLQMNTPPYTTHPSICQRDSMRMWNDRKSVVIFSPMGNNPSQMHSWLQKNNCTW